MNTSPRVPIALAQFVQMLDQLKARTGPTFFTIDGEVPEKGRTAVPLAATDRLWISVLTYGAGGADGVHSHTNEDHVFVVLQGRAEFTSPDFETRILEKHEAVLLPHGAMHTFRPVGNEPLAVLRIGAIVDPSRDLLEENRPDARPEFRTLA